MPTIKFPNLTIKQRFTHGSRPAPYEPGDEDAFREVLTVKEVPELTRIGAIDGGEVAEGEVEEEPAP